MKNDQRKGEGLRSDDGDGGGLSFLLGLVFFSMVTAVMAMKGERWRNLPIVDVKGLISIRPSVSVLAFPFVLFLFFHWPHRTQSTNNAPRREARKERPSLLPLPPIY